MFNGLRFTILPHLKCVGFIFNLTAMKEPNIYIYSFKDLVLIGDTPIQCESQSRRVACLLGDSSKMQEILAKAARNIHT